MQSVEAGFTTPLPETDALIGKPLSWKLGEIKMRTELFTYNQYNLFNDVLNGVRLYESNRNLNIDLRHFLELVDNAQKDGNQKQVKVFHDLFQIAFLNFRDEFGVYPESLLEILIHISEPVELENSFYVIEDWHERKQANGILPLLDDYKSDIKLQKKWLVNYACDCVSLKQVIEVLEQIQKANIEVKKKLLGQKTVTNIEEETINDYIPPLQRLWSKYRQKKAGSQNTP